MVHFDHINPELLISFFRIFSHFLAVIQMTVTWTSGYDIDEGVPLVKWGLQGGQQKRSFAATSTFTKNSMCGMMIRSKSNHIHYNPMFCC